ncbi:MAG: cation:proton antiporter [Prevotellaceae bacterium]|jgi:CPA2 family monovalent cation:H+ antiporter-2|nr:cation:proton antiporter [Prevotellaceae bacterium]
MEHLPTFITDLAIILISAGLATILFKWLKQPVVLGYILAGFLAGPYTSWLPSVTDHENVETWAEIGIIFLLFALGLEFSFKKLIDVGSTVFTSTFINLFSMVAIGYIVGQLLGWANMDSIFLGGMLSMSSTTIIIKTFTDMGLQRQKFAGLVFGMLIVEDLMAILMMVLLSTIAVSNQIEAGTLLSSVLKLIFFILIWFVGGIFLIPTFLKLGKKYLNEETLLIVSVGLCLGMVLFANAVGFSAALGAFIMGSILAETSYSHRIEHLIDPIKNFFGAVFFVSVGMMLNPAVIAEQWKIILLLVAVVVVGRIIFATVGVLASGEGLKIALQVAFSLPQIGEFSFIIATLGTGLGVISPTIYPIIVAVSIITTFFTPYGVRLAIPIYNKVEQRLPAQWNKLITGYATSSYKTVKNQTNWNILLKSVVRLMIIYSAIAIAIILLCNHYLTPFLLQHLSDTWGKWPAAVLTLALLSPFLRTMIMKKSRSDEFRALWNDNHFNRGALISLMVARTGVCLAFLLWVLLPLFSGGWIVAISVSVLVVVALVLSKQVKKSSRRMEARFLENLHHKAIQTERAAPLSTHTRRTLQSRDIHVEEIEIAPESPKVGRTLRDLNCRTTMGVSVITILRGEHRINIPAADEVIYPHDRLIIAGSDDNIQRLTRSIEERKQQKQSDEIENKAAYRVILSQYVLEADSPLIGRTLAELDVQRKTDCMIVCIDRGEHSLTNFTASFRLEEDDTLLLAGIKERLLEFEAAISR